MAQDHTIVKKTPFVGDSAFDDVIYYENDPQPYKDNQFLGLYKCYNNCPGKCVEFGITGNAFCFAK